MARDPLGHSCDPAHRQKDLSGGEPRDQRQDDDAQDAEPDDPGEHPVDVDHEIIPRPAMATGKAGSVFVVLDTRTQQDDGDQHRHPERDDDRRRRGNPHPDRESSPLHAAPVGSFRTRHDGCPTR